MPYFAADHEGCVTELECEIKNCEISNGSAVLLRGDKNKPFLSMDAFKLTGHMHYPVVYNDVHKWVFTYDMKSPVMFFLRSHWNILSDISTDWSDPGVHAHRQIRIQDFQPTTYRHEFIANSLTLHLNINEKNVIDHLYNLKVNNYATFRIPLLKATINNVGGVKYRANKSSVNFDVQIGHDQSNDNDYGTYDSDDDYYRDNRHDNYNRYYAADSRHRRGDRQRGYDHERDTRRDIPSRSRRDVRENRDRRRRPRRDNYQRRRRRGMSSNKRHRQAYEKYKKRRPSEHKVCSVRLNLPDRHLCRQVKQKFSHSDRGSSKGSTEMSFLSFQSFAISGSINSHWSYGHEVRLIDHYDVKFDLQGSRLALTPIVLHSLLQIRENYFGWSYFPCTSKEIKAWGGEIYVLAMRSRLASRRII